MLAAPLRHRHRKSIVDTSQAAFSQGYCVSLA